MFVYGIFFTCKGISGPSCGNVKSRVSSHCHVGLHVDKFHIFYAFLISRWSTYFCNKKILSKCNRQHAVFMRNSRYCCSAS